MIIKTVLKPFTVATTKSGDITANTGDKIFLTDKNAEYFNIIKLNEKRIFSTWKRKSYISNHCD